MAVNCRVVPSAIEGLVGVSATDVKTAALTVSVVVPLIPESVAEMIVLPTPTPVARPLLPAAFDKIGRAHV